MRGSDERFVYIDLTDKIMGIPAKHLVSGLLAGVGVTFILSGSALAFPLMFVAGYVTYRISWALEKTFPGTKFRYYRKWLSSPQVYIPGKDPKAIPLLYIPSDSSESPEGTPEMIGETS